MLVVSPQLQIADTELKFTFARSPGPGGQNVNKVNTKVTLSWEFDQSAGLNADQKQRIRTQYRNRINKSGCLLISSHRFREQAKNLADCRDKLRTLLAAIEHPPKRRRATRKTRASIRRRLTDKRQRSERKKGRQSPRHGD